jgi:peptidoglycan/LPS O-acetylase OafA/YrhL
MEKAIFKKKSLHKPADSERVQRLDVLRGLAIISVVAVHSIQATDNLMPDGISKFFTSIISTGKYGVEVFFFLSGWLLISRYENYKTLGKKYVVRRLTRIYPLWLLFLFIRFIQGKLNIKFHGSDLSNFSNQELIFLQNKIVIVFLTITFTLFITSSLWNTVIPGGWSIQCEIMHYLIFPLINKKSLTCIFKFCTIINIATCMILLFRNQLDSAPRFILILLDGWVRLSLYSTFSFFLFGIIWFKLTKQKIGQKFNYLNLDLYYKSNKYIVFYTLSMLIIPCPFGNQLEALGYLAVMIILSINIDNSSKISHIFQIFGKYSYFIYFAHFYILDLISNQILKLNMNLNFIGAQVTLFILIYLTTLVSTLILSIPSFKFFENPFINLGRKIR